MHLSETACDILDLFRAGHRHPGARMMIGRLDAQIGTDPVVAVAVSELIHAGYMIAPDADTVELTAAGFDALQRAGYRDETA
jgi:hypothetical protein